MFRILTNPTLLFLILVISFCCGFTLIHPSTSWFSTAEAIERQNRRRRRMRGGVAVTTVSLALSRTSVSSAHSQKVCTLKGSLSPTRSFLAMSLSTSSSPVGHDLTTRFPYIPPEWAKNSFTNFPKNGRLVMGNFPTPLYRMNNPTSKNNSSSGCSSSTSSSSRNVLQRLRDNNISLYVKRDDASHGCELTGNKIRKLELLLADALASEYDSVITIGGEQSNHCRATACAARMVGLEPHLILRTGRANDILASQEQQQQQEEEEEGNGEKNNKDNSRFSSTMGYTGNVLFDRMVGSTIYTCTPHEYMRIGSMELLKRLSTYLMKQKESKKQDEDDKDKVIAKPYSIPVGGSNGLGTFGYLSAVDEMLKQWQSIPTNPSLDHVVVACGSGGTAGGIAMGCWLAYDQFLRRNNESQQTKRPIVHAIGVCDSPDYFYNHIAKIADEMGLVVPAEEESTESYIRKMFVVYSGKGQGYARSTAEELDFISSFAVETGIVLDPVYSGKAMYHFMTHVLEDDPDSFKDQNLLFVHTGGALGLYEQGRTLYPTMTQISPVRRLDLYGKDDSEHKVDISKEAQ